MNRRIIVISLVALTVLGVIANISVRVYATSWGSPFALPNLDPYINLFPNLLQTSNSSAGKGTIWLVWEKSFTTTLGTVYLMTHNSFGWSGEVPLVSDTMDNITPALAELANGTIILVWSRGTGALGTYDLYWKGFNGTRWTSPSPLVQAPGDDFYPALARMADGRIWLVWYRSTSTNGGGDLYYRIYNGTWSAEQPLVATKAQEVFPTITQTADGRVWVVYQSNSTAGIPQLWYKVWNGTAWTNPTSFTSTTFADEYPSIAQDRSGVLWAFWSRELPTKDVLNPFQWDLFFKNSTNNGSTWSPDTQIALPQNTNSDEYHPTIIQAMDKTLWVVFASNQAVTNPYGTFNLYLMQSGPIAGHDVAVTYLKTTPFNPRVGEVATIYASVANLGEYNETLKVTLSINSTLVGPQSVALSPGKTATLAFLWNSTGYKLGRYQVQATVAPVPKEVITLNNILTSSFLLVPQGDVNRDGIVNIIDLTLIALRFSATTSSPFYWADADLNHDGVINILDLTISALNFGQRAI